MLYDIGFLIFSIFYLPTLLFKGKLHMDFLERFGLYSKTKRELLSSDGEKIWIQAVSVGEVALCRGLIKRLKERLPDTIIVISTITKTGNNLAKKLFIDDAAIIYFPLDFSFVVKRVVRAIRPKCYIMVETEIWPNLLKEIESARIPSILINGRISDRSFGKYKLATFFLKKILEKVTLLCMQSGTDAERIIQLGAEKEKVRVTGSMKFDIEIDLKAKNAKNMGDILGLKEGDKLFVAGSTHKGEEEAVLNVYNKLIKQFPDLRLLIAPRHVERAQEIEALVRRFGFEGARFSQLPRTPNPEPRTPIFILDTIGKLLNVYSVATLVFVGGSLARHGGQNPIEPAVFEKPILFGPHMFNFKNIASEFLKNDAAIQVADELELFEISAKVLQDAQRRAALGKNAGTVVSKNRGATERNLKAILEL